MILKADHEPNNDSTSNSHDPEDERIVVHLSDNWAILTDGLQWIVARRENAIKAIGGPQHWRWRHLAFVASAKSVLKRCISEKGVAVDANGWKALTDMPARFPNNCQSSNSRIFRE